MSVTIAAGGPPATADEKLMSLLRNEILAAREMAKSLSSLLTSGAGAEPRAASAEIGEQKKHAERIQQEFLSYFSRIAPSLYTREEWLGIFSKIGGIVDKLGGLAHRIEFLLAKPWESPPPLRDLLTKMTALLVSMMDSYLAMMNSALVNRDRALEARGKISSYEKEMDSLYREAIFSTLESKLPAHIMFLLLNIAEMIEDTADLLNSSADDLYLITIYSTTS
ncbi:MAG: hypothetical protein QXE91_04105 [Thermofilaceae archaeon]